MSISNSTILFIMHPERGHVGPTLKVVAQLLARGHRVVVTGPKEVEALLPAGRFEFTPLFAQAPQKPPGERAPAPASGPAPAPRPPATPPSPALLNALLARALRSVVERVRPALIVTDCTVLSLRELDNKFIEDAVGGCGARSLLLSTSIPNRTRFGWPDNHDPVLILCPRELDFPQTAFKPEHFYAESALDLERGEPEFPWEMLRPEKRLLYCSLGTESRRYAEAGRFLQTVVDAAAARPGWQLVLSTGAHISPGDFERAPRDAVIVPVAPQLKILERASLALTHGGLGTVKECIYFGVPMLVFPMQRDQPDNAARVVYHRLGLSGVARTCTTEKLCALIDKAADVPACRSGLDAMKKIFRERESSGEAVRLIEEFCSSPAPAGRGSLSGSSPPAGGAQLN